MRKFALLTLLLAGLPLHAQPPGSQIPAPTIRATTRMILLSVVATDKSGPVTNLTANDFSVLENGKPQKLAAFAFEQPALARQKVETPLPPSVYTNRPTYLTPSGPLTVLLLDALNTQATDQTYFRRELLQYLANQVRPGQRLAVFALGEQLHLLQDFTTDPELLRRAVQSFTPKTSLELQQDDVFAPPPPRDITMRTAYLRMLIMLKQLQADHGEMTTNQRVAATLAAFRTIARSVAGYPGRKNLVWVSSSFPLVYQPQLAFSFEDTRPVFYRTYEREMRETANIMGDAQISIYPVDPRGLVGAEIVDASKPMLDELGRVYAGSVLGQVVNRSSDERLTAQASMQEVADLTGGRAFVNRNDIDNAVALSVADGSSYYTLAYYPANKAWRGEFRTIHISVARKGVQLRYRSGYFATDASQEMLRTRDAELVQALRSDAPPPPWSSLTPRCFPPLQLSPSLNRSPGNISSASWSTPEHSLPSLSPTVVIISPWNSMRRLSRPTAPSPPTPTRKSTPMPVVPATTASAKTACPFIPVSNSPRAATSFASSSVMSEPVISVASMCR